jgi:MoxR-like ATPase
LEFQKEAQEIHVDETLQEYIVDLVTSTRSHPDLTLGASPRASLALFKTSQAFAALQGRDHVLPDDIKYLVPYTLAHRLIISPESQLRGRTNSLIVKEIINSLPLNLGKI